MIVVPSITSEVLDVELKSWAPNIADPAVLVWRSLVSPTYNTEKEGPPVGDGGWQVTTCELLSGTYFIHVPVDGLVAGFHGVWVRVAGSIHGSPARWCGQIKVV